MNKVSVIVPVYNMEVYLEKCVNSILKSSYQDIECILVDDGSKDRSVQMCDEYAEKDKRVSVIHKTNGGLTSARRTGFSHANGQYICFVDSDDYIAADMLEKLVELLEKEKADISVCGHYQDDNGTIKENTFEFLEHIIDKEDMISKYILPIIGKIYTQGYTNYPGYVWGKLYRRECISDNCFVSEREVYTEDDLFQLYVASNIQRIVFTNEKLCYYRENSSSLTHVYRKNMWSMLKQRHELVEKELKECHDRTIEERLTASAFYAVYVSTTNAYGMANYHLFKQELMQIRKDPFSIQVLSLLKKEMLRPRQQLFVFLFRHKFYMGLYYLRNLMF